MLPNLFVILEEYVEICRKADGRDRSLASVRIDGEGYDYFEANTDFCLCWGGSEVGNLYNPGPNSDLLQPVRPGCTEPPTSPPFFYTLSLMACSLYFSFPGLPLPVIAQRVERESHLRGQHAHPNAH